MASVFEARRPLATAIQGKSIFWTPALALLVTVSGCTKYRVASSDGGDASENDSSSGTGGTGVGGMVGVDGSAVGHNAGGSGGAGGSGVGGMAVADGGAAGHGAGGSVGTGGSGAGGNAVGGNGTGGVNGIGGSGAGGAGSICNNGSSDTCGHVLAALGTCAAGTTTCSGGKWGPCSILAAPADTCDIGNDDSCDGVSNTGCICDGFSPPADHPNPADYDTSMPGIVIDKATGRMWERNPPSTTYTQPDAAAYCAANRLGGFSNWRLPTVTELVSILDFSVASLPFINPTAFPNTVAGWFYTSTPHAGDSTKTWGVQFGSGEIQWFDATNALQVRCVR